MADNAQAEIREIYNALADDYEQLVPFLHGLVLSFEAMVDMLPFDQDEPFSFIDVGIGPGHLAYMVLDRYPKARITGLDLSSRMLDRASRRLERFADRVELVEGDIMKRLPIVGFDAAITSNALVYKNLDMAKCYGNIREALAPAGLLLNSTWVAADAPEIDRMLSVWMSRRPRREIDTDTAKRLQAKGGRVSSFGEDSLAIAYDVQSHLGFLRQAGFGAAAVVWRYGYQAILCGIAPGA
jgi:tRNA (cmo5U34)-methyltransferase